MSKNVYCASDFHLGHGSPSDSRDRERKVVKWLRSIEDDCSELFLLGDVFDFWFEYSTVVPKGYTRLLGQLSRMADEGCHIHLFVGNHDMWLGSYLSEEVGINIYYEPNVFIYNDKRFLLGHGDGLGPDDHLYKILKPIMRNSVVQWLYSLIPPAIGLRLMKAVSSTSRDLGGDEPILHIANERLVLYCEQLILSSDLDFIIFGHRHKVIDHILSNNHSRYINLGDWMQYDTYGKWDGKKFELLKFSANEK